MEDKLIQQISVDIESNTVGLEEAVQDALRRAGFKVEGVAWKATWKARDYWESKPPISSD